MTYEEAYQGYFSKGGAGMLPHDKEKDTQKQSPKINKDPRVIRQNVPDHYFEDKVAGLTADGSMDSMEQLCMLIKPLLNAAWGTGWGEFSPDLKRGENSGNIILPQITAEINERDIADGMPLKPVLMNTIKEKDGNGRETGDVMLIYRQWFDCDVEFNFYGRTSKEARNLMSRFESIIQIYTGYLKRHGVAELLFLREFSARNSLNFMENVPMRPAVFYIRFEKIIPVRRSLINKINMDVGMKMGDSSIKSAIEHNRRAAVSAPGIAEPEFGFDFESQDTGISYEDI